MPARGKQHQSVFLCVMPGIVGYGIEAYGATAEQAETLAKRRFFDVRRQWNLTSGWAKSFEVAMSYFGGTLKEIAVPSVGHEDEPGTVIKEYTKEE